MTKDDALTRPHAFVGRPIYRIALLTVLAGAVAFHPVAARAQTVDLAEFATGLSSPVKIANAGNDRLFVVEQGGTIRIVESDGTVLGTPFLNISGIIESGGEKGLLGLAFHPDYLTNGFFYVNYTRRSAGQLQTRVSRFSVVVDPPTANVANPGSEVVLLTVDQDFDNHNGGDLQFGPDGLLYIGLGDGGSGGDPNDNAQDPLALLGKMLRLDVDLPPPYVPATNPFVGDPGTADEIFALGLRNPWRYSFDRLTGDLYIGDVGQGAREEIDRQSAASVAANEARNWGWRCYEGNQSFNLSGCAGAGSYDFPIHDYSHASGRCSITGGYVYRGSAYASISGRYFYADYCTSEIFSLEFDGSGAVQQAHNHGAIVPSLLPTTFGEDTNGELYVAGAGKLYRVTADPPPGLGCDPAPRMGCARPAEVDKAVLVVRQQANPARNRLVWRWRRGDLDALELGAPTVGTEHAFCVYDAGETLIMTAQVGSGGMCDGSPCWAVTADGYRFRDRVAGQDGITAIVLKAGTGLGGRIVVRGKGAGLDMPPAFPLSQPVTAQLVNSDGECWEAVYSAPPIKSDGSMFRDRGE